VVAGAQVKVDGVAHTAVVVRHPPGAGPGPGVLARAPLHGFAGGWPATVVSNVDAVVFGAGGVGSHPHIVASTAVDAHIVVHLGGVGPVIKEVDVLLQRIVVGYPVVGQNLKIFSIARTARVRSVRVGLRCRRTCGEGVKIPGHAISDFGMIVFGFENNHPARFIERGWSG
jgi:hypothetical protein